MDDRTNKKILDIKLHILMYLIRACDSLKLNVYELK